MPPAGLLHHFCSNAPRHNRVYKYHWLYARRVLIQQLLMCLCDLCVGVKSFFKMVCGNKTILKLSPFWWSRAFSIFNLELSRKPPFTCVSFSFSFSFFCHYYFKVVYFPNPPSFALKTSPELPSSLLSICSPPNECIFMVVEMCIPFNDEYSIVLYLDA